MRKWLSALSAATLLVGSDAQAAFIFIPGFVIDKVADAFTGGKGENCVPASTKVGDLVSAGDGSLYRVESLSGTSRRCQTEAYPVRAELIRMPQIAGHAVQQPKATLPLGYEWTPQTLTGAQKAAGLVLHATNSNIDAGVSLSVFARGQVVDMEAFALSRRAMLTSTVKNASQSEIARLTVANVPGWHYTVTGLDRDGVTRTFAHTILEGSTEIALVSIWALPSAFERLTHEFEQLSASVTGLETRERATAAAAQPRPVSLPGTPRDTSAARPSDVPREGDASPSAAVVARKLALLKQLLDEKVITEDEYAQRRLALIDSAIAQVQALPQATATLPSPMLAPTPVGADPGTLYFCCNMRSSGGWISDSNSPDYGKTLIPLGTQAKITGYGRYRVYLEVNGDKQALGNDYSRDLPMPEFAGRYLVPYNPASRLSAYPALTRRAIQSGRLHLGMTREQVLMSVGYPVTSENPLLDARVWRFSWARGAQYSVYFDANELVKDVVAEAETREVVLID